MDLTVKQAKEIAIGLSEPSKMPCSAYSIPAWHCHTGSKLQKVEGSVCFNCYAMKNRYTFPNVKSGMEKRFDSLSDPMWVEAMVTLIRETNKGDREYFRWHDSGDVQSEQHLDQICEIARRIPEVKFWLPTKEWKICRDYFKTHAMPENLNVRLSMPNVGQKAPEVKADDPFTYSEVVHIAKGEKSNLVTMCPAKNQGDKCDGTPTGGVNCRSCWKKEIRVTTYPEH